MTSAMATTPSSSMTTSRRGLRITLWVLQVALALFFMMVGYSHALAPFEQVSQEAVWMQHVPRALGRFIGYAELAGGLGLIIPAATRIAPWLTPLAALGLATIMILALLFHIVRGEARVVGMHVLLAALALLVAWGRWRKAPISNRKG